MMKAILLEHTPNPDKVIARAASQCYSEGFVGDTYERCKNESDDRLIQKVIEMGHTSVLEHASFTFAVEGISRICSHQLVRFRHSSFSQQSQRYVTLNPNEMFEFIITPSIKKDDQLTAMYKIFMNDCKTMYDFLIRENIPAEDARFILPNAAETKIIVTMNAREIYHACNLRQCFHSQWEIQNLFNKINELVKEVAPVTFAKLGPSCVTKGFCTEGKRSCGKINNKN